MGEEKRTPENELELGTVAHDKIRCMDVEVSFLLPASAVDDGKGITKFIDAYERWIGISEDYYGDNLTRIGHDLEKKVRQHRELLKTRLDELEKIVGYIQETRKDGYWTDTPGSGAKEESDEE